LLADPETQWEPKKSALEMAVCWEAACSSARGLPPEVAAAIDGNSDLAGAYLVLGLPEHQVAIPGGGHSSQNDLWALLRRGDDLVSVAIEAKAGESLDALVKDWLRTPNPRTRKPERLAALQGHLDIDGHDVSELRYQLLHRAASALIEADRFRAKFAVLLVQSFNRQADEGSWNDCCRFGEVLGAKVCENQIVATTVRTVIPLYIGWISSSPANEDRLRTAV
jgi:hypothetical protein